MFRKIKQVSHLLFLQLTAWRKKIPFEQIVFTNPLSTDFDSILHEQVKGFFSKAKASGLIIGISQLGEKSCYSYGYADPVNKKPFTAETIFEIGSVTKTFTANLLFQLSDLKIIDIQNSVLSYLPPGFGNDLILQKIILSDIASHTSGLPRIPSNLDKIDEYKLMQPYQFYTKAHLYTSLKTIKNIKPGTYDYSNLGYGLIGTIEENATSLSYESLLNKYIFQPLQMNNSYIDSKKKIKDTATGYFFSRPAPFWNFDCLAGAGAIRSNVADILKYLDAHIECCDENFSNVVHKITQPVLPVHSNMQICYGWHTFEDLKHRVFWHDGGTFGFSTIAAFEPVTRTSIVLTSNSMGVNTELEKLATDLMILLMGK